MVEKEKGDRMIPLVAEVLEFGHSIGASGITITPGYEQWRNQFTSPSHPFYKNGFEQLEVIGIDFSQGILRRTKELVTVGWQPLLG